MQPVFGAHVGVTSSEFRQNRCCEKTSRVTILSNGVVRVLICSVVLVKHQLVTNGWTRWTDRWTRQ